MCFLVPSRATSGREQYQAPINRRERGFLHFILVLIAEARDTNIEAGTMVKYAVTCAKRTPVRFIPLLFKLFYKFLFTWHMGSIDSLGHPITPPPISPTWPLHSISLWHMWMLLLIDLLCEWVRFCVYHGHCVATLLGPFLFKKCLAINCLLFLLYFNSQMFSDVSLCPCLPYRTHHSCFCVAWS